MKSKPSIQDRLKNESLLKSWFWQGESCGEMEAIDEQLQKQIELDAIESMKKQSVLA